MDSELKFSDFYIGCQEICGNSHVDNYKDEITKRFNISKILYIKCADGETYGNGSAQSCYVDFISDLYHKYGEDKLVTVGIPITTGTKSEQNSKSKIINGTEDKWLLPDYTKYDLMFRCAKAINELDDINKYMFVVSLAEAEAVVDINTPISPKEEADNKVLCPTCMEWFYKAQRCPECGQKILYV